MEEQREGGREGKRELVVLEAEVGFVGEPHRRRSCATLSYLCRRNGFGFCESGATAFADFLASPEWSKCAYRGRWASVLRVFDAIRCGKSNVIYSAYALGVT